jgi:hypothetical protein
MLHSILLIACLFTAQAAPSSVQSRLGALTAEYHAISGQLKPHIANDWWIDDQPGTPALLAKQWSLTGEWLAAWLNLHSNAAADEAKAALRNLAGADAPEPECLKLADGVFLASAPNLLGNVFIVARSQGQYRLAWSIAEKQQVQGKAAETLAAWRPENAREGGRGPYWAASGRAGTVAPALGVLSADSRSEPRFYVNGIYNQMAGATVGAQVTLWLWDGTTARPLLAREYALMIDQERGARVEGDLLKVEEKKSFRAFFSCGSCEERQTEWSAHITADGIQDLGEKSLVPELDAVDELFYRVIHRQDTNKIAAPQARKRAAAIVEGARAGHSRKDWKEFPTLGMMGSWKMFTQAGAKVLCFYADDAGANLFTLKSSRGRIFITHIAQTEGECEK